MADNVECGTEVEGYDAVVELELQTEGYIFSNITKLSYSNGQNM